MDSMKSGVNSEFLLAWLQKVAAAVSAEPSKATIEAYLEELARWKMLTDAGWEELRRRAVMRHRYPRILPLLSELSEIASEIIQESEARENARRAMTRAPDEIPMPADVKAQLGKIRLVKP